MALADFPPENVVDTGSSFASFLHRNDVFCIKTGRFCMKTFA